ncbi:MAG: HlyU family transcriptional regulator, partial [Pseudomonadota bacterium]
KLFGGGGAKPKADAPSESYKGFEIYVEPISESGGYRIAARIVKDFDGDVKTHQMIRADVTQNQDEARTISLRKAQMLIDEQGDSIFR